MCNVPAGWVLLENLMQPSPSWALIWPPAAGQALALMAARSGATVGASPYQVLSKIEAFYNDVGAVSEGF